MKAILVIDIDDSLIEGEERFAIDGYLMQEADCDGCYEAVGYIKKPLKPMPKKEELISKILFEVDGGTDDRFISYCDICKRVEQSVNDWFEEQEK